MKMVKENQIPRKQAIISDKAPKIPHIVFSNQRSAIERIHPPGYVIKRDGIMVHTLRTEDHRAFKWMLDESSHEYHTFRLSEDETLRVVLRRNLQIISAIVVKQNLLDM